MKKDIDEYYLMESDELETNLSLHRAWLESDGQEGEQFCFGKIIIKDANLSKVNLDKAYLDDSILLNVNFESSKLRYSQIFESEFVNSNINNSDLFGADWLESKFKKTTFVDADLRNTNLSECHFDNTDFSSTDFSFSDLNSVIIENCILTSTKLLFLKNSSYLKIKNSKIVSTVVDEDTLSTFGTEWIKENQKNINIVKSQFSKSNSIVKSINFSPEHHQAGMAILSYFNTILQQKYPMLKVGVTLKQEGMKVIMIIEMPDGSKQQIEKLLSDYGLVVNGHLLPQNFLDNQSHILALKHKIEMANMELRHSRDMLYSERNQYENRILSLEQEISNLTQLISSNLSTQSAFRDLVSELSKNNNVIVLKSIRLIEQKLNKGLNSSDKQEILDALLVLKKEEPSVFQQVVDLIVKGSISGTAGNLLSSWLVTLTSGFPR